MNPINPAPPPTVLVIDDDPDMLALLVHWLEGAGYTVIQGMDAASALALTRAHHPALVLLDVVLPDGDGREVARQIKTDPELADTFVTLLTAQKISPEDQAMGLSAGQADGYILRPVPSQVLLGWVQVLLRLQATQMELRQGEALRQSEEKYRTVADFTYDWEYWVAPDGSFLYISPSCERITGYRVEEFQQNPAIFEAIIHPADRALMLAHYQETETNDEALSHNLDFRIISRAGEERWINHVCRRVYDRQGNYLGRRASNRDITERKQMEETLREREERLEFVFNATSDGLWEWDVLTGQIYLSPQYYRLLGYEPGDFEPTYERWLTLVHPDDRLRWDETIQAAFAAGRGYDIEFRLRTKDGGWKWSLERGRVAAVDEHNVPVKLIGTNIDITDRKRAEDSLRESEFRARAMLKAIPDLMFRMNREGVVLDYKADIRDLYFQSEQGLTGNRIRDISPPEFADLIERQIQLALENGILQTFEYELPVPGRGVRDYEARMVASGVDEVTAIVRDVTDRKEAEEILRQSEKRFRALVENSADALTLLDAHGNVIYEGPTVERVTGYTVAERLGRSSLETVCPEDLPLVKTVLGRVLTQPGHSESLQFRAVKKDASIQWMEGIATNLLNEPGVRAVVVNYHDITARRQAEDALRDSNELFSLFMAQSPIYAFIKEVTPTQSRTLMASENYRDMIGIPGSEMVGKLMEELFPADIAARFTADDWAVVSKGEVLKLDEDFNGHNYTTLKFPIHQKGRVLLAGYTIDITDQVRAREALRESDELFSLFMEHSPIYVYIKEVTPTQSRTLMASRNFQDMLGGIPTPQIIGKTMEEIFPPDAAAKFTADDWAVVSAGKVLEMEEILNGRIYTTVKFPIRQRDKILLAGYTIDVTDLKQAEKILREREENFRALAENASDGILILSGNGDHLYANQRMAEISGYSVAELLTIGIQRLAPPDEAAFIIDRARRRLAGEDVPRQYEFQVVSKDGQIRPVEISAGCTIWQGEVADLVTMRDITDRKKAEETRAKMDAQHRQIEKAESLNRMAAAIAHHFNNQLQGVIGYLELATASDIPSRSERLSRNLAYAGAAAHKAAEMSGLMLTYLGLTYDEQEPLSLSEICAQALPTLMADLPENVLFETDLPPNGPVISANAQRLCQLLGNLVTNAWESMSGNGGVIHLSVTTVSADNLPAGHRFPPDWQPQNSLYACLVIMDTGSGIAPQDIEKIFDPFFTGKFLGRGLGLPVALGIMRGHAGAIVVQSELGRGSTFQLLFPALPWV